MPEMPRVSRSLACLLGVATLAAGVLVATSGSAHGQQAPSNPAAVQAFGSADRLDALQRTESLTGMVSTKAGQGYWVVDRHGVVQARGDARHLGDLGSTAHPPIVGLDATSTDDGYWLVANDGSVYGFGAAPFLGAMAGTPLNAPIVDLAASPTGDGYWMVASDGGVFAYGTARYHGSMGGVRLNEPVVGMAASPSGEGYWLVASDGGVFAFGDARFWGSAGDIPLNQPVVDLAPAAAGGYWLAGADGGVFTYGFADFLGSLGAVDSGTTAAIEPTPDGTGYWLLSSRPAGVECSAAGLSPTVGPQAQLPTVVADLRSQITTAAVSCSYDELARLARAGSRPFTFTFGGAQDPAAYWRTVESEGQRPLEALVRFLETRFATSEVDGETLYVWPAAFTYPDWASVPTADRDALRPYYSDDDLAAFAQFGSYTGFRVGITAAGDWLYFVAGD
jgi:hypothetical protein